MKRGILVLVALLVATLLSGNAFAAKASPGYRTEIDGMLSIASDPGGDFGSTLGLGVGMGFDLSDTLKPSSGKIFGRVDINYFNWDQTVFGVDLEFTRIPIFVGGRYYIPTHDAKIDIFVEAGLEFSFDDEEVFVPGLGKASSSDLNIGLTPGIGIEVPISNDGLFVGGDARWHIVDNDYFTVSFVIGKRF